MIKKSVTALLLAYAICVLLPFTLSLVFTNTGPPSDGYSSLNSYHSELYKEVFICAFILLLFSLRKRISTVFKVDEVIYFHFLLYLFFYSSINLISTIHNRRSDLFYTIEGARKIKDSVYGYVYPANGKRHEKVIYADSLLLNASYTFDTLGRRSTPQTQVHKQKSILFFGCSFTYGDGVNDYETLPSKYAIADTNSNVYNYAIDGWGPQQTLQELTHKQLSKETNCDTAIGIYVWIDDHLKRASLFKSHYRNWTQFFPCFLLQDDSLVFKGSFESVYPLKGFLFGLLDNSIFFKNIDIPCHETAADYVLCSAILKASQRAFLGQFKSGKFVVLLYPGSGKDLIPYLKKENVDYIACNEGLLTSSDYIPRHGHPNKSANQKLSNFLYRYLTAGINK